MTRTSGHGTRPDIRARAAPRRPPLTRPAIEVAGLSKRFGPTVAVDGLSFTASYGRITGFLGPNGAGKTVTGL